MTEGNHKTDSPACETDEPAKSDSGSHSYYYDDATGYEIFQDDDDGEDEEDRLRGTDEPS